MKKISTICVLLLTIILVACNDDNQIDSGNSINGKEVAKINNDGLRIIDESDLRVNWEALLKDQGLDVSINEFQIQIGDLNKDGNQEYILVATTSKESVKSGIALVKKGDSFYRLGGGSVTCTGHFCTAGCSPKKDSSGAWYCTDCTSTGSNGVVRCSKTETVDTNLF